MANALEIFFFRLVGADVKLAVNMKSIGVDDLPAQALGKFYGNPVFAGISRTGNNVNHNLIIGQNDEKTSLIKQIGDIFQKIVHFRLDACEVGHKRMIVIYR